MKRKWLLTCLSLFCFATHGCKKALDSNTNGANHSLNKESGGFDFDQFGISHNNFLVWMDSNNAAELNDSACHALALSYTDEYFGDYTYNPSLNDFLISVDSVNNWSERIVVGNFDSKFLADQNVVSDSMIIFLNNLSDIFYTAGMNDYTPDEFSESVSSLEDWVVSNYVVSIDEEHNCSDGGAMLAISSIAKHSYDYWYNNYDSTGASKNILSKAWRAVKIASCEAYGFVVDGWDSEEGVWDSKDAIAGAGERSRKAGD